MEAINSEIAMSSSYCGFQSGVTSTGTITYESLLFESNNIKGASFNKDSGRYTAGVEGNYRVDLNIGDMGCSSGSRNDIFIQRNGVNFLYFFKIQKIVRYWFVIQDPQFYFKIQNKTKGLKLHQVA